MIISKLKPNAKRWGRVAEIANEELSAVAA